MNDAITTHLALAAVADIGRKRAHQEDTFLVVDLASGLRHGPEPFAGTLQSPGGIALAAIDAMGASFNGAEAGHLAAEAIRAHLSAAALPDGDAACRARLKEAMSAAHRAIQAAIEKNPLRRGMGCAVTLAVVCGDRLHLAQVGDTRAYVLRAGRLVQVTRDDTLRDDAQALGATAEEIELLPAAVITKAVGLNVVLEARASTAVLRAGDVLLVCSDGLSGEVDDGAIARTLGALGDPGEACRALLEQALKAGGRDNVTILVARPLGEGLQAPGPGEPVAGLVGAAEAVLAGLDEVAWDTLRHAYGTAEDVPESLRAFLSADGEAADDAYDFVVGSLWHQGTVYPATARAVPFLVRLLGAAGVRRRGGLACGVALIAQSGTACEDELLRQQIRSALHEGAGELAAAARRYPALREAVALIQSLVLGKARDAEARLDELFEGLEDREIDPPPSAPDPPAEARVEPSVARGRDVAETLDDWVEWDPARGPTEAQRFDAALQAQSEQLERACAEDPLPGHLEALRLAFRSSFVSVREEIARREHPLEARRGGGLSTMGYQSSTSIDWRCGAELTVTEVLGPVRVLEERLGEARVGRGFRLWREKGRFLLATSRPVETCAQRFEAFLGVVHEVHAERDRLLGE